MLGSVASIVLQFDNHNSDYYSFVFLHGFEPRSSESESEVLTVTPQENIKPQIKNPLSFKRTSVFKFQYTAIPGLKNPVVNGAVLILLSLPQ